MPGEATQRFWRAILVAVVTAGAAPALAGDVQDPASLDVGPARSPGAPGAVLDDAAPSASPLRAPARLAPLVEIVPDPPPAGSRAALPPLVGSLAGCGLLGGPLGACSATSALVASASILSIFAVGAPPVVMLLLFGGGFCVALPTAFCLGPASAAAAGTGAMIATREYNDRDALPALIATVPPVLLALVGSAVALVGTVFLVAAALGTDAGRGRAAGALIGVGVVTSLAAGPLAAFSTVAADLLFGGPYPYDEAGAAAATPSTVDRERPRRRRRVSMTF